MFEAIPLPAGFEVADGVAGDSAIYDFEVISWVFGEEVISEEVDVAETEGLVGAQRPAGVGDTVADK